MLCRKLYSRASRPSAKAPDDNMISRGCCDAHAMSDSAVFAMSAVSSAFANTEHAGISLARFRCESRSRLLFWRRAINFRSAASSSFPVGDVLEGGRNIGGALQGGFHEALGHRPRSYPAK